MAADFFDKRPDSISLETLEFYEVGVAPEVGRVFETRGTAGEDFGEDREDEVGADVWGDGVGSGGCVSGE